MKRRFWNIGPIIITLLVVSGAFAVATLFWYPLAGYVECALWLIAAIAAAAYLLTAHRSFYRTMRRLTRRLDARERETLASLPCAAVCVSVSGEVLWFNSQFEKQVPDSKRSLGQKIEGWLGGLSFDDIRSQSEEHNVQLGEQFYTVVTRLLDGNSAGEMFYLLYFWEDTALKQTAEEYRQSRPVVLSICIDNLDELLQNARDSERAGVSVQIEKELEDWIGTTTGMIRKYDTYRFLAVCEYRDLQEMVKNKFSILNRVRAVQVGAITGVTLSIGVGCGKDFHIGGSYAQQAVEMALGRGGDQAAVRTDSGYDFYGGRSQGVERRTKVRTRVIANVMRELIDGCETVLLMGHRYSDLDCLGSAVALAQAIRAEGKAAYVAVNRSTTLARELLERYDDAGFSSLFLDEKAALAKMTPQTLLMITDTHSPDMLEYLSLYQAAHCVIVVDHHRKMVKHIENAVIFYHEPYASSASEMVAELLPYLFPNQKLSKLDAESLLAGMVLDTRGFVMKAGSRTFEAAAYLRRAGADPVDVKRLSAGSMELYHVKSGIVAQAETYKNTVIACCEEQGSPLVRVAAAQAADELLSVKGADASFTLFAEQDAVNISARSYGACNVQLIMEAMGGGGHMTMAGAQVKQQSIESVLEQLKQAIDQYEDKQDHS